MRADSGWRNSKGRNASYFRLSRRNGARCCVWRLRSVCLGEPSLSILPGKCGFINPTNFTLIYHPVAVTQEWCLFTDYKKCSNVFPALPDELRVAVRRISATNLFPLPTTRYYHHWKVHNFSNVFSKDIYCCHYAIVRVCFRKAAGLLSLLTHLPAIPLIHNPYANTRTPQPSSAFCQLWWLPSAPF